MGGPADLPDPGIDLGSPALQADSLPTELSRKYFRSVHSVVLDGELMFGIALSV